MLNIERLNRDFAIAGQLEFVKGEGGFPMVEIHSPRSRALISLYGGQILSFQPAGEAEDLLFLSGQAHYQSGKAIKGGIPVCWPWFGPDPEGTGRPAHGFVRNRHWDAVTTRLLPDGSILVRVALVDSHKTRDLWSHPFQLAIEITVGTTLNVELVTRNTGDETIEITQALHTYFRVGDVRRAQVLGLEGSTYLDKVDGGIEKSQVGPVTIDRVVDRIYAGAPGKLEIVDESLQRRIRIDSRGSDSVVVWNPWSEIAASMGDLADDDYQRMLCVETANAGPDKVTVTPGDTYRLGVKTGTRS